MKNPEIIIPFNNKRYCAYCGKEIQPDEQGKYRCSCKDAQQAYILLDTAFQLEFEAAKKRNQIPKPRFGLQTVIAKRTDATPFDDDAPDPCV